MILFCIIMNKFHQIKIFLIISKSQTLNNFTIYRHFINNNYKNLLFIY